MRNSYYLIVNKTGKIGLEQLGVYHEQHASTKNNSSIADKTHEAIRDCNGIKLISTADYAKSQGTARKKSGCLLESRHEKRPFLHRDRRLHENNEDVTGGLTWYIKQK